MSAQPHPPPHSPTPADDAPPPGYDAATAAGSSAVRREQRQANQQAEQAQAGEAARASDVGRDERPLPEGWIKLWHSQHQHFYYVDTTATPPRSIWTHPFDDPAFLKANPQFRDMARGAESGGEGGDSSHAVPTFQPPSQPPPPSMESGQGSGLTKRQRIKAAGDRAVERAQAKSAPRGIKKITRGIKDSTTGTDYLERKRQEAEKVEAMTIAREERQIAAQAFITAAQTGQPQFLGKDEKNGVTYVAEPPQPGIPINMVLSTFPPLYGFESRRDGNTLFFRPACPPMYASRGMYGGGYGGYGGYRGGMGLPIMGGVLGGALLGGMLF